jgi:hypothetical protein
MDVRDMIFWTSEARRKSLARTMEAYNAALLPYQDGMTIRAAMEELSITAMEAITGESAALADIENADLIARAKERKREAKLKRKAGGKRPPDNRKAGRKIRRTR